MEKRYLTDVDSESFIKPPEHETTIKLSMSDMQSDVQWFIARESEQHGPLSEAEMRVFIERGHLRKGDLVWRQGFPDWRPAAAVFPPLQQDAPVATAPINPQPQSKTGLPAAAQSGRPVAPSPANAGISSVPEATPAIATSTPAAADNYGLDNTGEAPRRGKLIAATVAALVLIGGGLGYYFKDRADVWGHRAGAVTEIPTIKAPKTADAKNADSKNVNETSALPPKLATPPQPKVDIDARLQKAELWQFLKGKFPKWYSEFLSEANKLPQKEGFDGQLSELLVKRIVALRRLHADKALSASGQSLASLASSFLANLKDLAGRGAEPCYKFISSGESSPAVIDIMRTPGKSTPVHSQLLSIFKASVEGTAAPTVHSSPQKQDYEALTNQLSKIGWSKDDIQLFANPKALAKAPHARVCQMVQDWFTAHLSIKNAATQERLLFETLRPVVSG